MNWGMWLRKALWQDVGTVWPRSLFLAVLWMGNPQLHQESRGQWFFSSAIGKAMSICEYNCNVTTSSNKHGTIHAFERPLMILQTNSPWFCWHVHRIRSNDKPSECLLLAWLQNNLARIHLTWSELKPFSYIYIYTYINKCWGLLKTIWLQRRQVQVDFPGKLCDAVAPKEGFKQLRAMALFVAWAEPKSFCFPTVPWDSEAEFIWNLYGKRHYFSQVQI